jgi:hypothetical protein
MSQAKSFHAPYASTAHINIIKNIRKTPPILSLVVDSRVPHTGHLPSRYRCDDESDKLELVIGPQIGQLILGILGLHIVASCLHHL